MRLAGKGLLLLSLAACSPTAERLRLGASDTVVVNNRGPVMLPVHAFDGNGREFDVRRARVEQLTDDDRVRISSDGVVTCLGRGDAEVLVTAGARSARGVVRCQPIRGFRFAQQLELLVGGPPRQLVVDAIGVDDAPITALAGRMSVLDTSIARLVGDRVYPKALGETFVDVEAGDCETAIRVEVWERVSAPDSLQPYQEFLDPSLRVGLGELRRWHIPTGRFDLRFEPVGSAREPLVLAGLGLNCARFPDEDGQHYSCVSYAGGTVVVRHPGGGATTQSLAGRLLVRRLADRSTQYGSSDKKLPASNVRSSTIDAARNRQCMDSF